MSEYIPSYFRGARLRSALEADGVDTTTCMECSCRTIAENPDGFGPAAMECHHIDERWSVDEHHYTRLQVLCPNCHSRTEGFRGRKS